MARRPPIPVFDIGNVLLRWDPRYLYRKLIRDEVEREDFLARICPPEWNLQMDGGKPFAEAIAERVALYPDRAELIRAFDERWPETLGGAVEGTVVILEELRARKVRTYAITNFSGEKFAVASRLYPFLAAFDGIVISGQERVLKPDRRIYELLCDRYELAAAECLFIDDSQPNIEAAEALGMQGHLFTSPKALRVALKEAGLPLS